MFGRTLACGLLVGALFATPVLAADKVKIGFVSTLSGPGAALGVDIRDGFNLAVRHAGGKLGGLPVELTVRDDRQSADTGKQEVERLLQQNHADIITGIVFSNVLLPVLPAILDSKTFYISPNTGPMEYAGAKCNPYFFVSSWQNDEIPGAMGELMNQRGYKNVYLIGANYPGGRESIGGFKKYYKGKIANEQYTPMGQLDYSAELAQIRAARPDSVFFFLPGGMGINFIKQYVNFGLSKDVQLFTTGFSADEDTIKPVGEALLGAINSSQWGWDLGNPANQKFVADFRKEYGRTPTLYASQGYDTAMLIDGAIRDVKGRIENKAALRKALEAARFNSVRGSFRFGVNHYPVQDYYLRVVRKDEQGHITNRTMNKIFENKVDPYAGQCRMPAG
ncbi:MAG TPA: ABC transporter substrate-binding protein [Burkholderiales bacterium]|jgi:branched-chain amino acid transport system substrate-binding protein